jgi:hypothetical protein
MKRDVDVLVLSGTKNFKESDLSSDCQMEGEESKKFDGLLGASESSSWN